MTPGMDTTKESGHGAGWSHRAAVRAARRFSAMRFALIFAALAGIAAVAVWSLAEILFVSDAGQLSKIRAGAAAGALFLGGATFECIRRTRLRERYALLWFFPSAAILLMAFFPGLFDPLREAFGLSFGSVLAVVAFVALMLAVFVFSIVLSRDEADIASCARHAALLEARVRNLEAALGRRGGEGESVRDD